MPVASASSENKINTYKNRWRAMNLYMTEHLEGQDGVWGQAKVYIDTCFNWRNSVC